ncbi:hypothetical protein AJ80_04717 [Polytolypa hystricis UAMH7299]|uniref:Myb-like DNA-binding domain-containing protein n=1 Tax=Polytolypa hystricis (strain UAMH7299) TaxID=1447883 RepID=A0A2B7Y9E4_POLH7|nr:hypothetical protein AJ80_04717 [Polytolypa hystricis UAMH7299]
MSRTSSEEQFNFLLKCVKHSNNGKVDFEKVAQECAIVSKGAAAKRYERMMKANGINPNGGPASPTEATTPQSTPKKATAATKTPTKGKAGGTTPSTGRKRKARASSATTTPGKKKVKTEPVEPTEAAEAEAEVDAGEAAALIKQEITADMAAVAVAATAATADAEILRAEDAIKKRARNDPFLEEGLENAGQDAEFKEFCGTHARVSSQGYAAAGDVEGDVGNDVQGDNDYGTEFFGENVA